MNSSDSSRFNDPGNMVEAARSFALKRHGDQRYGNEPYEVHLNDVVSILLRFADLELLADGWLHDVVEDTSTTREEIAELFGVAVADVVFAVSSEPGKNRKERNAATYPKIRANHKAVIVKLADRLANVRYSFRSMMVPGNSLFSMYKKEYPAFREALYYESPDIAWMWLELDRLMQ